MRDDNWAAGQTSADARNVVPNATAGSFSADGTPLEGTHDLKVVNLGTPGRARFEADGVWLGDKWDSRVVVTVKIGQ